MELAVALALSFFIGSLPFGYWIAKTQGVDIRKVGSGNVGATNVARALGKRLGLLVFVLDILKGAVPAGLAYWYFGRQDFAFYAGVAAVIGHCISPFLGFKGGKGVATGLGLLVGSSPAVAGLAFAAFLVVFAASRYVSLSSLVAAATLVPLGLLLKDPAPLLIGYAALTVFIFYRHRANIKRLSRGQEPKFTFGKGTGSNLDVKEQRDGDGV